MPSPEPNAPTLLSTPTPGTTWMQFRDIASNWDNFWACLWAAIFGGLVAGIVVGLVLFALQVRREHKNAELEARLRLDEVLRNIKYASSLHPAQSPIYILGGLKFEEMIPAELAALRQVLDLSRLKSIRKSLEKEQSIKDLVQFCESFDLWQAEARRLDRTLADWSRSRLHLANVHGVSPWPPLASAASAVLKKSGKPVLWPPPLTDPNYMSVEQQALGDKAIVDRLQEFSDLWTTLIDQYERIKAYI